MFKVILRRVDGDGFKGELTIGEDCKALFLHDGVTPNGNRVAMMSDVGEGGGAPLDSPHFTGIPLVPTAALGTSTLQAASTQFVAQTVASVIAGAGGAPLDSPHFTGSPTAPSQPTANYSTLLATTQFFWDAYLGQGAVTLPLAAGTAATGVSTAFARADHVHPSDTSRAPLNSPAFTGIPTVPTATPGTSSTQAASTEFVGVAVAGAGDVRIVESFTASGADDTAQLRLALAWLQAAPRRSLTFGRLKQYTVSGNLTLNGAVNFRVEGNGATIKAANGMSTAFGTQILFLTACTDGLLVDFLIDSNRANRTPQEIDNHGIQIYDNCQRLRFIRVQSNNACCDGWYIGANDPTSLATFPTDIELHECGAKNAFRNNQSLINTVRFRDFNGVYNGAIGTAPEDGVDCEPNGAIADGNLGNIDAEFHNTTCDGNNGLGFQIVQNSNKRIKFFDITARANASGAFGTLGGEFEIRGITVEDHGGNTDRGVIDLGAFTGNAVIQGVTSQNNLTLDSANLPLIYVDPGVVGLVTIDGVKSIGCDCPVLIANAPVTLKNVESRGQTSGYVAELRTGANASVVSNVLGVGPQNVLYINAPDVAVSKVTVENPVDGSTQVWFDTGALRGSLDGYDIFQSSAVPAGQVGVRFETAPARATNIAGRSAGTAWTAAQLTVFAGGTVGSILANIAPFAGNGVAVASLPTSGPDVFDGATRYCTNARNTGEGAGAGTGALVMFKTGKGWRIPGVATAVTA